MGYWVHTLLMGVKRMPALRNMGYTKRSKTGSGQYAPVDSDNVKDLPGTRMMMASGSKFWRRSFGTPCRAIVFAWLTMLSLIWLYVIQYKLGIVRHIYNHSFAYLRKP